MPCEAGGTGTIVPGQVCIQTCTIVPMLLSGFRADVLTYPHRRIVLQTFWGMECCCPSDCHMYWGSMRMSVGSLKMQGSSVVQGASPCLTENTANSRISNQLNVLNMYFPKRFGVGACAGDLLKLCSWTEDNTLVQLIIFFSCLEQITGKCISAVLWQFSLSFYHHFPYWHTSDRTSVYNPDIS